MSLLLSNLTPWIDETVFQTLREGPLSVTRRPKIVQVLARGGPGWIPQNSENKPFVGICPDCPCYVVVQDGKTSIVAFLNENPSEELIHHAKRGSLVRISDWNVSTSGHCALNHLLHLQQRDDRAAYFLSPHDQYDTILCFSVGGLELLGAQGMGVVGNPVNIHQSIDVRRALQSMQDQKKTLSAALHLPSLVPPPKLGNVYELLATARQKCTNTTASAVDTLVSLAQRPPLTNQAGSSATTVVDGVVLGNVQELLAASRLSPQAQEENRTPVQCNDVLSLAHVSVGPRAVQETSRPVVLGDVSTFLQSSRTATTVSESSETTPTIQNLLARAQQPSPPVQDTTKLSQPEPQEPSKATGPTRKKDATDQSTDSQLSRRLNKKRLSPASSRASRALDAVQEKVPAPSQPRITPVQQLFSAVLNVFNESTSTTETRGATNAARQESTTRLASQEPVEQNDGEESSDDSDSGIVGISEMLLSQTQTEKDIAENTNSPIIQTQPETEAGVAALEPIDIFRPRPPAEASPKTKHQAKTREEQGKRTRVCKKRPVGSLLRGIIGGEGVSIRAPKRQRRVRPLDGRSRLRALMEQHTES